VDLLRDYRFGPSVSGWQALAAKLNPLGSRDRSAPLIFESLLRVLALNDVHQAKTKRGFADVYIRPPVEQFNILDFGAYRQIADIGYRSAMAALEEWEELPRREGAAPHLLQSLTELEELLARMKG
jgi:predicted acylesterase/phospholipase RssA